MFLKGIGCVLLEFLNARSCFLGFQFAAFSSGTELQVLKLMTEY